MKRFLFISILCLSQVAVFAQNLPKVYNQFFMNPYVYNPAYAGVEGHTVLFLMYKQQWAGINNAPSMSHVNFHIPLKGGMAFGAMAYRESNGLYVQSGGKITGGYLISIDRTHFLRFGLSLGAGNNTINFGELDSPTDVAFTNLLQTETFLLGDAGVAYHFGHFNIGLSLPSLFGYDFISTDNKTKIYIRPQDNLLFKMNYRGHLNDKIAIEPHLLYRYNKELPDQFEATVILHLLHIVWVGGSYRQHAGYVGLLGMKIKERMGLGYSYEYGNPTYASLMGPTHEIHIGYHLSGRHGHAEHAHSFIKSHSKSAEERAKEAELERQRKLQALQKSREPAQTKAQEDELTLVVKEKPKVAHNWNYERENEPVERTNQFGEVERGIKFDRINEKGEKEVVFSWLPPPPPGTTEETYEIANPNEEPIIRVKPNGTKEAGIKWIRTLDNGKKETLIVWDEILTEEQASKLDHNPSKAMALNEAKITIRREIVEEPKTEEKPVEIIEKQVVTKPQVKEEPVAIKEEPKIVDKPIVKEEPKKEDPKPIVKEEPKKEEPKPVVKELEKVNPTLTEDFRSHEELAKSETPQVVKKGNHLLELQPGNYVVAGVFDSFQHAEDQSDVLFNRGFHDTKVGYISARGHYYVVIYESTDIAKVNRERNRVKNLGGLSKVWVLTVEE